MRRAIRRFNLHYDAMVYARQLAERTGIHYEVELGNRYLDRAWKVVSSGAAHSHPQTESRGTSREEMSPTESAE